MQAFADGRSNGRSARPYVQKSRALSGGQLAALLVVTCALGSMLAASVTVICLFALFGSAR
jgi:hypothetical protein